MNGFLIALRSELFVALHTLGSKLVVFMPALLVLIQYLLSKLRDTGTAARDSLTGTANFDAEVANNAYGHFVDGLDTGITLLGLLLIAQAAYSFSGERDSGAIRHVLIRSSSRSAIALAKLAQLHILAILSILVLVTTCYITSSTFWEFGPVIEDGFELISEEEIRQEISLGLRLALLPLPAAIALGLTISIAANTATQAVVSALGLTLMLDLFKSALGDNALYLYVTYQPSLLDQSYLQDVSRLVRGFSDVLIDNRFLELNNWVPLPSFALLLAIALLTVRQRKI